MYLTKKELQEVSMGYRWSPNMSYERFKECNQHLKDEDSYGIYNLIDDRYIDYKYGEGKKNK